MYVQFSATTCKIRLFGQLTCVSVQIRSLHAYSALAWHATSAWSHCQCLKTLWSNQRVVNLHGPPESVCQAYGHRREITEIAIENWWVERFEQNLLVTQLAIRCQVILAGSGFESQSSLFIWMFCTCSKFCQNVY